MVQVALTEPVPTGETGNHEGETEKPSGESEKPMEVEHPNGETGNQKGKSGNQNRETEKSMEVEHPNRETENQKGKSEKPSGETEKLSVDSATKSEIPAGLGSTSVGSRKGETLLTGVRIPREKIETLRSKLQGMKAALVSEGR